MSDQTEDVDYRHVETPMDHVDPVVVGAAWVVLRALATAVWCAAVPLVVATVVVGFDPTPHALVETAAISAVVAAVVLEVQVRRLGRRVSRQAQSRRATT